MTEQDRALEEALLDWLVTLADGHGTLLAKTIGGSLTASGDRLGGDQIARLVMTVGSMLAARYATGLKIERSELVALVESHYAAASDVHGVMG